MAKTVVLLANGVEEIEAVTIIDILRRGNVQVITAAVGSQRQVNGSHGIAIFADTLFRELTDKDSFDMVILPGGAKGVENIGAQPEVLRFIKSMAQEKWVAAICAAPSLLAKENLLQNKKATSYPSFKSVLVQGGAEYKEEKICRDEKLVTSQGPATAIAFALHVLQLLTDKSNSNKVAKALLVQA